MPLKHVSQHSPSGNTSRLCVHEFGNDYLFSTMSKSMPSFSFIRKTLTIFPLKNLVKFGRFVRVGESQKSPKSRNSHLEKTVIFLIFSRLTRGIWSLLLVLGTCTYLVHYMFKLDSQTDICPPLHSCHDMGTWEV